MLLKFLKSLFIIYFLILGLSLEANARNNISDIRFFNGVFSKDTIKPDLQQDSTLASYNKNKKSSDIEFPVYYPARDSITIDFDKQMVYLWGEAKVTYDDIELTAEYMEINMSNNTIYARGITDSLGNKVGRPHFKQGEEEFSSDTLRYNFTTKNGYINGLVTEQEGGFLHSEATKRIGTESICIQDGKYTTCDHDDPHFYVALTKAKVIPNDKIVSGPVYLVIADIPMPVWLPFGFFPNQKKFTSGILFPEYGEEANRGFFLRNGGYYFALSDYFDLSLRGDIYSKGTWGMRFHTNYKLRYKFSGNFDVKYFENIVGERDLPNFSKSKDFSIVWTHSQDAKANPGSSFSANVNLSSSSYDQNQTYSSANYLNNTKSSSISYSKSFGSDFNFSANLRHSQNSLNKSVSMTLPSLSFNVSRQYPFRRKNSSGDLKWYENIEYKYSSKLDNQVTAGDSVIFTLDALDYLKSGFQHDIPISANFKLFKYITLTPSVKYRGRVYTKSFERSWDENIMNYDSTYGAVRTDTIEKVRYVNEFAPNLNISISPSVYGMYQFKKGRVKAIRHVVTPSLRFNYKPDMGADNPAYWKPVPLGPDSVSEDQTYSVFTGSLYGSPTSNRRSGVVSLGLGNNLEMKMKSKNDTIDEDVKVKILESLSFSTSYDMYKEVNKWNPINFSGRTTLFNTLKIAFGGTIDPYTLDEDGLRTNNFELSENSKLGRLTSANFSSGFTFRPKDTKEKDTEGVIGDFDSYYVDFDIPWTLKVDYSWNYNKPRFESVVTQTLTFNGDLKLTPKWKIGFRSGYDIEKKDLTYTTIDIYRDMHCWEARFTWIPFGYHQSYNFKINVKSSVLKDLKWAKRKSWYDNF